MPWIRRTSTNDPYPRQRIEWVDEARSFFQVLTSGKPSWEQDPKIEDPVVQSYVRSVFQEGTKLFPKEVQMLEAYLSFERANDPGNAGKVAKSLLKVNKTNLRLWHAYAQLEEGLGKLEEARKVYNMALSQHHHIPPEHQLDVPLVFRAFAELEIEAGNPLSAISLLASAVETSFTPLTEAKALPRTKIAKVLKVTNLFFLSQRSINKR